MNLENPMSLTEALSICAEAAEHRADMWREAANGFLAGSAELDCFAESSPMECNNMAALLEKARMTICAFRENYRSVIDGVDEDFAEEYP